MSAIKAPDDKPTMLDRSRGFDSRCRSAVQGIWLPRVRDLILGCPFFKDDIRADVAAFAEGVLDHVGGPDDPETLFVALGQMTVEPTRDNLIRAAEAFDAASTRCSDDPSMSQVGGVRCYLYAALTGCLTSANKVAAYAMRVAYSPELSAEDAHALTAAAVAWLLAGTGQRRLPDQWTMASANEFLGIGDTTVGPGRRMLDRMIRQLEDARASRGGMMDHGAARSLGPSHAAVHEDLVIRKQNDGPQTGVREGMARVVMTSIGNAASAEGRRVASEFQGLVGQTLPLGALPDLSRVRAQLYDDYPHAVAVTDAILDGLAGHDFVKLPPTVLAGPTGCGKTTFAKTLARLLNLPVEVYPCGGADSALAGTPRRWSTGEACVPLSLIRAHLHAGPMVILDELEKAASSRASGSLLDALLGFLEPGTARSYRDPYVEAAVDLSGVAWLGCVNNAAELPAVLRDRCRIIAFPEPRPEHLPYLARAIMRRLLAEHGLHPGWAAALDGTEQRALSAVWRGGSIRSLSRLVEAVLTARERPDVVH